MVGWSVVRSGRGRAVRGWSGASALHWTKEVVFLSAAFVDRAPTLGTVPNTNPLSGRVVTDTRGDAETTETLIARDMLVGAGAPEITAVVDVKIMGSWVLTSMQNGQVCFLLTRFPKQFARGKLDTVSTCP